MFIPSVNNIAARASKIEMQTALFIAQKDLQLSISDDLTNFIKHLNIDKRVEGNIS